MKALSLQFWRVGFMPAFVFAFGGIKTHFIFYFLLCVHICVDVRGWCPMSSSITLCLIFWSRVSSWIQESSMSRTGWKTSSGDLPVSISSSGWDYRHLQPYLALLPGCWGSECRSPYDLQVLYHGTILTSPQESVLTVIYLSISYKSYNDWEFALHSSTKILWQCITFI